VLKAILTRAFGLAAVFWACFPDATSAQTASNPDATPTPVPALVIGGIFSGFGSQTNGVNATGSFASSNGIDGNSRIDISNLLITANKTTGTFRYSVIVGEYAFPTLGQALNATLQPRTNTQLYTLVPVAYVQFVPNARFSISAGKLPALLGQESDFTYQNLNVQRGVGWALEPTVSRGARITFANSKFAANLEYNDGFYTGSHRAFEGSIGWQWDASGSAQFAVVIPQNGTPGNATAPIANKREYDFMVTKQYGRLQLLPYVLEVDSPQSTALAYSSDEHVLTGAFLANYAFSDRLSLATRIENVANSSLPNDGSVNADMIGYGAGSAAQTFTVTPQYKNGHMFARAEYSRVSLGAFTAGLGFGPHGTGAVQSSTLFEVGAQY